MTEWSIHEVARRSGTTTRALRHYDAIGILRPTRTGANGYRYYGAEALVRLQRILLLRDLGLGLSDIAEVLEAQQDPVAALRAHIGWLRSEQDRLARQIAAVESTITSWEGGELTMTDDMFDGFDHTVHKEEVEQRWGAAAYARSDEWWRGLDPDQRNAWKGESAALAADWAAAAHAGVSPSSADAHALAERHVAWLRAIPGTPAHDGGEALKPYVLGIAQMYASDPRFAANYATPAGGTAGAEFVRDALTIYAESTL
ncbi:MerR family transcriptional regulator [Microbacterium sp. bgisy207]|uniref:MerR family transcriptional regulator n=1 Tax=Microbacterium sp. bgisy207 TaxID=3413800 RepID=UPI003EC154E5